jgi:hypothetical protein
MGSPTNMSASDQAYAEGEITDTERAIFGSVSMAEMLSFFSEYARTRLGSEIATVRFRASRL